MDRSSPEAPLLTNCLMIASALVICLRCPFSFTTTASLNASSRSFDTFFEPLARPPGLPDMPLRNWVSSGGLPYPTLYFFLSAAILLLPLRFDLVKRSVIQTESRLFAGIGLPTTYCGIHVKWIDF